MNKTLTLLLKSPRARCRAYWVTGLKFREARAARTRMLRCRLDGTQTVAGHHNTVNVGWIGPNNPFEKGYCHVSGKDE